MPLWLRQYFRIGWKRLPNGDPGFAATGRMNPLAETAFPVPLDDAELVAACDDGRAERECEAARQGLAEARRQARMRVYERAF